MLLVAEVAAGKGGGASRIREAEIRAAAAGGEGAGGGAAGGAVENANNGPTTATPASRP